MVFAHRVACVKPRFPKKQSKTKSPKHGFYENGDFENSEKYTETQAKSMVFAHRVACVKPRFPNNIQKLSHKTGFLRKL